jgi:dienelactone hydrolase
MASRVLHAKEFPALQPSQTLWAHYHPESAPLRFTAQSPAAAAAWQTATRAELFQALGFQDLPPAEAPATLLESVDKGDFVRQKWLLPTSPYSVMPVYLLVPKTGPRPLPVVLAFHGHGYGVKDIVGLWENGDERDVVDGYHQDFGVALCRQGFAVAAPEISCFGERQNDFSHLSQGIPKPAFHLGGSAAGLRVLDGRRLVDWLATKPQFDTTRLGAMGISGGGLHTFFSACADPRIKAVVVSGYFCLFRQSVLAMNHCFCNFIPGLGRFGEIFDLAGLIAPRPLLVEAGTRDPIFPLEAVHEAVAKARQVYGVWGAEKAIETDIFEGRHRINGTGAYPFLRRHLGL